MRRSLRRELEAIRADIRVVMAGDGSKESYRAEMIRDGSNARGETEAEAAASLARYLFSTAARVEALGRGLYHVTFEQTARVPAGGAGPASIPAPARVAGAGEGRAVGRSDSQAVPA